MRPYIGGSQGNSLLELIVSYNGLGRITGEEVGSVGGGRWGSAGLARLFEGVSGGMVSWLLPAALVLGLSALVVAVAQRRGTPAADQDARRTPAPARALAAGAVVWTGWLVVTAAVFSLMAGIYHDYYTVALAPAIGGAIAVGGAVLWARRGRLAARLVLAATSAGTGVWALLLLQQAGGWYSVLGWGVLALSVLAAAGLAVSDRLPRVVASLALGTAVVAALAGPYAYSVNTAATAHTGSIVTAGPVSGVGSGPRGGAGGRDGGRPSGMASERGTGGLLNGASASSELVTLLQADGSSYAWVAATVGAQNAASYQLATGLPVMAIGGFNGSDPSPTLAQFQADVAQGRIHYFIAGGVGGRQNGGSEPSGEIADWVAQHYSATTVAGTAVYDLTTGA